jgi:inositol-pentakisphosphate 2-kinase
MASVSALVDVSATEPEDWTYVAEGGASLVVRYSGTPNPTFTGRVLRIRKCPLGAAVSTTLADGIEQEIIHFQGDIVTRLLPSGSVPLLVLALVEPPWLDALAKRVEGERPLARQAIDRIDSSRSYAILAPNLIDPAGISVEIKVPFLIFTLHCLSH